MTIARIKDQLKGERWLSLLETNADNVMPEGVAASFTPFPTGRSQIRLRSQATEYEFLHEFQHLRHFEELKKQVGVDEAYKWFTRGDTRIAREQWAFDALRRSAVWDTFSAAERSEAIDYILRIGGNAW